MSDLRKRLAEVLAMMAQRGIAQEEMLATVDAMAELLARPALARALEDAERYDALNEMCCSGQGPSDALVTAWLAGDEAMASAAIDAARTKP